MKKIFLCIRCYSFSNGDPMMFEKLGIILAENQDEAYDNEIFKTPHKVAAFADFNFWAVEVFTPFTNALALIAQEREEQITKHGRTVEYDKRYNTENQLPIGAIQIMREIRSSEDCPSGWSMEVWVKMITKPRKQRLAIADALIAAEIDRIS